MPTPHPEAPALRARDGLRLHWREWPAATPRGTVLIVHGLGEHIERYAHVAAHLNAAGWNVAGWDHRGHGHSEGPRGGINESDDLLHDLAAAIAQARQRLPGGPLVVLGHSMGGLIAARFVAGGLEPTAPAWWQPIDALVLSSPALDPGISRAQRVAIALGQLAPTLPGPNGLKPAWISRDPAVVAAYQADPLVHGRITPRLAHFIVRNGEWVLEHAAQWKLPTLLMYGGADRCVSPQGSARFAEAAPAASVRSHAFTGLYHEIFNEPEQRQVLGELTAWLDERFGR